MISVLISVVILGFAFNVAFLGVAIFRAARRKKLINERSIDRLMAAHFASARNASRLALPLSSARSVASLPAPSLAAHLA